MKRRIYSYSLQIGEKVQIWEDDTCGSKKVGTGIIVGIEPECGLALVETSSTNRGYFGFGRLSLCPPSILTEWKRLLKNLFKIE